MNDDDRGDIHPSTFRPQEPGNPTQLEIDAALFRARRLGILLNKTRTPDGPGAPGCWLGGAPTLPEDIEWPWFTWPRCGGFKTPMRFVAQINLRHLPRLADRADMAQTGTLFFFVDPYGGHFWLYPDSPKDPSTIPCRVIHVDADVSACPPRPMPDIPDLPEFPRPDAPELALEYLLPSACKALPGGPRWREYIDFNGDLKGIRENLPGPEVYRRWAFDFLVYESFANPEHLGIEGTQVFIREILANQERLGLLMEDRYDGADRKECGPEYRARAHMFNDIGWTQTPYFCHEHTELFELFDLPPDEPPIRLLAILDDQGETGFRFYYWIVFYIREADLKAGRFDKVFVVWENT